MAIFKCKMCGGEIEFERGATVGTCVFCGTKQTLPRLDDDRRANLYDRANHFRRNNDFDKAAGIYETILAEDPTDAEAYWSLVLCRYGIEYVEDPATKKRVPTVNRAQYTSIFDDDNYRQAIQYADFSQRSIYEEEAAAINEIQKGILAISQQEEPFDVFVCYKETDAQGRRTPDSVLANDLYHQLTQEGFKVFFSRITLEDKLGTEFEPYIFAALNSAKVMVVLGTKPEHFNAAWVKNEWSRYLALVRESNGQKTLIPAYRDMDPYDLPDEFSHLQAQDMSKLGFMQDLIRGIKKITGANERKQVAPQTASASVATSNTAPLLRRAFMFLEDGEWARADELCEQVLNLEPENAEAYLGKLMAELHARKPDDLKNCAEPFDNRNNFKKAVRFGDEGLRALLEKTNRDAHERAELARQESKNAEAYNAAAEAAESAVTKQDFEAAAQAFERLGNYLDSYSRTKAIRAEWAHIEAAAEDIVRSYDSANRMQATVGRTCHTEADLNDSRVLAQIRSTYSLETICSLVMAGVIEFTFGSWAGELMKWRIIVREKDRFLAITEQAIDCRRFDASSNNWKNCELKRWLEEDFERVAFNDSEKRMLASHPFCLSAKEARHFFKDNAERVCYPTSFAIKQGARTDETGACIWWLRSPGLGFVGVTRVQHNGRVSSSGYSMYSEDYTVRPAIWLKL